MQMRRCYFKFHSRARKRKAQRIGNIRKTQQKILDYERQIERVPRVFFLLIVLRIKETRLPVLFVVKMKIRAGAVVLHNANQTLQIVEQHNKVKHKRFRRHKIVFSSYQD